MRVQVVYVDVPLVQRARPHLHGVSDIAVMHVGRIIRIQTPSWLSFPESVFQLRRGIGGHVYYLRRIANGP